MKVEKLEVLKVGLENEYYVLIVPNEFVREEGYRDFFLMHEFYGHVICTVGCCVKSDEEALEIVNGSAEDWIRWYKEDMEE